MNDQITHDILVANATGNTNLFIEKANLLCQINKAQQMQIMMEFQQLDHKRRTQLHPMLDEEDLRNVIFQDINDDYSYGQYGDFDVIIMRSNGYVNATKLCADAGKQFKNWKANTSSQNLISVAAALAEIPAGAISVQITGGDAIFAMTRGTYVHRDLLPHIASWCNPEFAIKVSKIVNRFIAQETVISFNRELAERDNANSVLRKAMAELLDTNAAILQKSDQLLSQNAQLKDVTAKMSNRLKQLILTTDDLNDKHDDIVEMLESILDDRVIKSIKPADTHAFVILKNNDPDGPYQYHSIRRMKASLNEAIRSYISTHPGTTILVHLTYSPNPINLWHRIKAELSGGRKIKFRRNDFKLRSRYTETRLLADVNRIHNERLRY